ncbi:MAG: DUF4365 domain-containing protein [Syntrophomonas sp.]
MRDKQLPKYTFNAAMGDLGVRIVEGIICDECGMIFRRIEKSDVGIDAEVEIIDDCRRSTGRLLAFQIKCGSSYFQEEKNDAYIIRVPISTFNYWESFSLPVIFLLCDPAIKKVFWCRISLSSAVKLKKSYKIIVPKVQQLDASSRFSLMHIANEAQITDIIELSLFRFLHIKYYQRIDICITEPRDFWRLSYVGSIDNKISMFGFYYDRYGIIALPDIEVYKELYEYNMKAMAWNIYNPDAKLILCIISKSKNALVLNQDVIEFFNRNNIEYIRLVFSDAPFYSFEELDESNNYVQYFY